MNERNLRQKETIKHILINADDDFRWTITHLATFLRTPQDHQTEPKLRELIRELIREGCPIGSDHKGYYWIRDHDQLEDCLEGLQTRCDAIQNRIVNITSAYNQERNSRYLDTSLDIKDRCRHFVIYIAETAGIPYQAVWTMAYRKLQKITGVDLVNLPVWYQGSVLNYCVNKSIVDGLYSVLTNLEGGLI